MVLTPQPPLVGLPGPKEIRILGSVVQESEVVNSSPGTPMCSGFGSHWLRRRRAEMEPQEEKWWLPAQASFTGLLEARRPPVCEYIL